MLDSNILIEIDPTYTHNVVGNHWNNSGIDKNYHIDKTHMATKHNYRCIHVFDWDDADAIISLCKPKKQIYGRCCDIHAVPLKDVIEFLNLYHIQHTCRGQLYYYGLYYNNQLVEVMTFGKSRYSRKYEYELLRLCTRPNYKVVGGASKLFKRFIHEHNPQSIVSYCDVSKFSGDVYEKLGMKLDHTTPPQEIWSKGKMKITANLLRARGYDQLFNTNYGKGSSNEQLMIEHGWLPVYDCGQNVYVWHSALEI